KVHSGAAHGLHWAYGVSWPLGMAALSDVLGLDSTKKTIAAGAILGAIVWAVGYAGWLPALGLAPPVHRVPIEKSASGLATHVALFALGLFAVPASALERDRDGYFHTGDGIRVKKVAFIHVKVYAIDHYMKDLPAQKSKQAVIDADVDKRFSWKMLRSVDAE